MKPLYILILLIRKNSLPFYCIFFPFEDLNKTKNSSAITLKNWNQLLLVYVLYNNVVFVFQFSWVTVKHFCPIWQCCFCLLNLVLSKFSSKVFLFPFLIFPSMSLFPLFYLTYFLNTFFFCFLVIFSFAITQKKKKIHFLLAYVDIILCDIFYILYINQNSSSFVSLHAKLPRTLQLIISLLFWMVNLTPLHFYNSSIHCFHANYLHFFYVF